MHIQSLVSITRPSIGGVPNRIHNVELVAHLVDDKADSRQARPSPSTRRPASAMRRRASSLHRSSSTASLTTGSAAASARSRRRSSTRPSRRGSPSPSVRTHALYISHYLQGRDATVRTTPMSLSQFVNDTGNCYCCRTYVHRRPSLHGRALTARPVDRKVTSTVTPLIATECRREEDDGPSLKPVVRRSSTTWARPALSTSVTRDVYAADGSSSTTIRGTRRIARCRSSCGSGRSSRSRRRSRRDDDVDDDDSTRPIASRKPVRHARWLSVSD